MPIAPPAKPDDLSDLIARSVERRPDERLRVVRLFNDCYRCNWWVQDKAPHPHWLLTGTIRKSRFIRAEMKGDQLIIRGHE
jgi:hypothetical protein